MNVNALLAAGWINSDNVKPLDQQIVLGYWPKNAYLAFPLVESLSYYADQDGEGDTWYDAHGDVSDPPAYWRPYPLELLELK